MPRGGLVEALPVEQDDRELARALARHGGAEVDAGRLRHLCEARLGPELWRDDVARRLDEQRGARTAAGDFRAQADVPVAWIAAPAFAHACGIGAAGGENRQRLRVGIDRARTLAAAEDEADDD